MKILDCTLRDGGYYNQWDFDIQLVNEYLKCIEESRIDSVEIGFRSPQKKNGFSNATDEFIVDNLYIPKVEYIGVMLNGKEMDTDLIKSLFIYTDKSPINLVRICIYFKDVEKTESLFKELKNLGYFTTCNLMQAADKSYDEIKHTSSMIQKWDAVDVLYLADSFGGMTHDTVNYAFKAIKESWNGLTGFHGHNNKGQALSNSLEAIDTGVDWIDGTILGMGRGPGNCETEYLLNELNKQNYEFEVDPLYKFAMGSFHLLKDKYKWGPSLSYYLSAEYNIHPTYIQELLYNQPKDVVLKAINYLKNRNCKSFDKELLRRSIQ